MTTPIFSLVKILHSGEKREYGVIDCLLDFELSKLMYYCIFKSSVSLFRRQIKSGSSKILSALIFSATTKWLSYWPQRRLLPTGNLLAWFHCNICWLVIILVSNPRLSETAQSVFRNDSSLASLEKNLNLREKTSFVAAKQQRAKISQELWESFRQIDWYNKDSSF